MTIFGSEAKDSLKKFFTWLIVLIVFVGLLTAFYPLIAKDNLDELIKDFVGTMSPKLRAGFFLTEDFDPSDLGQYLALTFKYISLLTGIFAIQIGAKALAREEETGNIQYLYSNPISRSEIVTGKLFAGIFILFLFYLIFGAVTFGICFVFKTDAVNMSKILTDVMLIFLGLFAQGLVFLAIGLFISSFMRNSHAAESIGTLIVLVLGVVAIVSNVMAVSNPNSMINFGRFLPFAAFGPTAMMNFSFDIFIMIINLIVFIIFLGLSYLIYLSKQYKY